MLSLGGIACSYSRGPYLYACAVFAILLLYGGKKLLTLLAIGGVTAGGILVVFNGTVKRILSLLNDKDISFSGRIIGGCLDVLTTLVGTSYADLDCFNEKYKEDGIIWYLESCELNTMAVIRQLTHLKRNNWFKYWLS
jgi:hypothetical protein